MPIQHHAAVVHNVVKQSQPSKHDDHHQGVKVQEAKPHSNPNIFHNLQDKIEGIEEDLEEQEILDALSQADVRRYSVACNVPEETVTLCWETFRQFDTKNTGYVDADEVKVLLEVLGRSASEEQCNALRVKFDKNGDDRLDFDEFIDLFASNFGSGPELLYKMAVMKAEATVHDVTASGDQDPVSRLRAKGCRESSIKEYLDKEMCKNETVQELPFAIGLFVFFAISLFEHNQGIYLFTIDKAVESDITENGNFAFSGILPFENGHMGSKGLDDVNNIPDFWSWLSMGIVPLLWIEVWDVSEVWANTLARCTSVVDGLRGFGWANPDPNISYSDALPPDTTAYGGPAYSPCHAKDPNSLPKAFYGEQLDGKGMYLYFNRVIGGLRMRQERQKERDCGGGPLASKCFGTPGCFDGNYWLRPDMRSGINTHEDLVDASRTRYLRQGLSQAEVRQEIMKLETARWLDPSVQKIELSFPTLNAELGTLTMTFLYLYFNRAGHIFKKVDPVSVWLDAYRSWLSYVTDILWLLMTLKMFTAEAREVIAHMRKFGCCNGLREYIAFWNTVDWISIVAGFVMCGYWITYLFMLKDMNELLNSADPTIKGGWQTDAELDLFFGQAMDLMKFNLQMARVIALYIMVIVLRFFKAFNAQPRLAVVTRTLSMAAMDILHFGFVFCVVLVAFAVSGLICFGEELEDFEHITRSINTCWRALLGDFDFDALYKTDRLQAVMWFYCIIILVFLIMMNMLLAIIMDVYTEVKASVGGEATMMWQVWTMLIKWWRRRQGKELSNTQVLKALDQMEHMSKKGMLESKAGEGEEVTKMGSLETQFQRQPSKDSQGSKGRSSSKDMVHAHSDNSPLSIEQFMEIVPNLDEKQATDIMLGALELESESTADVSMSASVVRLEAMNQRSLETLTSLNILLGLCSILTEDMHAEDKGPGVDTMASTPASASRQSESTHPAAAYLEGALGQLSPTAVSTAVEKAFAQRVDPVLAALAQVRDDVAFRVGELGKDLEKRFGALHRHAERVSRELEHIRSHQSSRDMVHVVGHGKFQRRFLPAQLWGTFTAPQLANTPTPHNTPRSQ